MHWGSVWSAAWGDIADQILHLEGFIVNGDTLHIRMLADGPYTSKFYAFFINGVYVGSNSRAPLVGWLEDTFIFTPGTDIGSIWVEDAGDYPAFDDYIPSDAAEEQDALTARRLLFKWTASYSLTSVIGDSQLSAITITGAQRGVNVAAVQGFSTRGELTYSITNIGGTYIVRWFADKLLVAEGSRVGNGALTCTAMNSSGMTVACTIAYTTDVKPQTARLQIRWPAQYYLNYSTSALVFPRTPEYTYDDKGTDAYVYLSPLVPAGVYNLAVVQVDDDGNVQSAAIAIDTQTINAAPAAPINLAVVQGTISQLFNATGVWTCPAGVTSVQAECWGGGGGGGGGASHLASAGGGGGGAYAKKLSIPVIPGTNYTVNVGTGGGPTLSGNDSWFDTMLTVIAVGGAGGGGSYPNTVNGGGGGQATSCIGDVKYSGGQGGTGVFTSGLQGAGAGGGGSAGTGSNGNNGANGANGMGPGGAGGAAVTGGGAGGQGGEWLGFPGPVAGSVPGGGGGGDGDSGSGGANGADGKVLLTYAHPGDLTLKFLTQDANCSYDVYYSLVNSPINYGSYAVPAPINIALIAGADVPVSQNLAAITGFAPVDRSSYITTLVAAIDSAVSICNGSFSQAAFPAAFNTLIGSVNSAINAYGTSINLNIIDFLNGVEVLEQTVLNAIGTFASVSVALWANTMGYIYGQFLMNLGAVLMHTPSRYQLPNGAIPGGAGGNAALGTGSAADGSSGAVPSTIAISLVDACNPVVLTAKISIVVRATKSGIQETSDQALVVELDANGNTLSQSMQYNTRVNNASVLGLSVLSGRTIDIDASVLGSNNSLVPVYLDYYIATATTPTPGGNLDPTNPQVSQAVGAPITGIYAPAAHAQYTVGANGWYDVAVLARDANGVRSLAWTIYTVYVDNTVPGGVASHSTQVLRGKGAQ